MLPSDVMETTLEGCLGVLTVSKRDLLRIEVLTEGLAGRRTVASCFITENAPWDASFGRLYTMPMCRHLSNPAAFIWFLSW
jgi:hypothetical protein